MSAPSPNRIILEAKRLVKYFGGDGFFSSSAKVHAVDGVSLRISRGETFALVGESGCGKSTLGRLLLRLIEPTAGDILYENESILAFTPKDLRKLRSELQIIFQDPFASLNPCMTVGQIIGEPIWLHGKETPGERLDRVAELLRIVGLLPRHAERYAHEFSGGQRQRIGIARALAGRPKLIIGDEPVSALDVSIQAQIINLLEDLKERFGLTLIIVAHDLAVIRHMSDRVAVMYLGEIVELSETDALFDAPLHPYTQALLAAIPIPSAAPSKPRPLLQGDVPNPAEPPSGCRFHTRCPHARPLCSEARPSLESTEHGRHVACHFWKEIQGAGAGSIQASPPGAALTKRLALYRRAYDRNNITTAQNTADIQERSN